VRFTFSSFCAAGKMLSTCKEEVERTTTRLTCLIHSHVLPQTNAAELRISPYLSPALGTCAARLSYAYLTKATSSFQFTETMKVEPTSPYGVQNK